MEALKKRCVIVGGGDCTAEFLKKHIDVEHDYIICADSGYDYVSSAEIQPDLLIGDFDSISSIPKNMDIITLPVEKDVTDTVAAYYEGIKLGYEHFILFGGTGGRFEHTLANISLMAVASRNKICFKIIDETHIFRSITNSSIKIPHKDNQQISIFAFGSRAFGVTLKGFHYPLWDFTLDPFNGALGTSNDIVDAFGEISVTNGTIVIVETKL